MDGVLSAIAGALPQLGLGGIVTFVCGLLVKLLLDERGSRRAEVEGLMQRHASELSAVSERLEAARRRIEELETAVDLEREARRRAEDEAARLRRELESRGWSA